MKATIHFTDEVIQQLVHELEPPTVQSTHNVFHDLVSCVVEQQIHYRSTKKIFAKALERAGLQELHPQHMEQFEQLALSHIKLSQSKYETLLAIQAYWNTHQTDFASLSDEAVRAALASIKGIGSWTIDMILLYTLNRPNIFPVDDFHLKQIMVSMYGLNPNSKLKAQMLAIAENWGNQKSLAVLYLLAWKKHLKR